MNKWTIIALAVLALFIGFCLAYRPAFGIIYMIVIAGSAALGYLIGARRVKHSFLGFLIRFGTVFLALHFLEATFAAFFPGLHTTLRNLTATIVGATLSFGGADCYVSGPIIVLENSSLIFDISVACLGGALLWLYIALVLATPAATSRQRLTGVRTGLAILLAFNFFRITLSIYLIWLTGVDVHGYFYFFNFVFVLLVEAGWLRTLKPSSPLLSRPSV